MPADPGDGVRLLSPWGRFQSGICGRTSPPPRPAGGSDGTGRPRCAVPAIRGPVRGRLNVGARLASLARLPGEIFPAGHARWRLLLEALEFGGEGVSFTLGLFGAGF